MHQWNLVYHMESSLGSTTIAINIGIKLQSVGMAVKHDAPTDACPTNRQPQNKKSNKHRIRRVIFCLCKMLLAIYKVFRPESLNLVKVLVVSHCLTNNRLTRRKFWRIT